MVAILLQFLLLLMKVSVTIVVFEMKMCVAKRKSETLDFETASKLVDLNRPTGALSVELVENR
jgi:hypothetical protein